MKKKIFLLLLLSGAFLIFTSFSYAAIITYGLNFEYSGATAPAGTAPWLTATFDDDALDLDSGAVRLTMDATGLTGAEKVGAWLFNLNADDDRINNLGWEFVSSNIPNPTAAIESGPNAFNAGPAHGFDIEFDFFTNGINFGAGGKVVFDLFLPGGSITANSFVAYNSSGIGPFTTAAHVQGIGSDGQYSGWIAPGANPVPEPATMLLLGIGLIGLAGFGRRRIKT